MNFLKGLLLWITFVIFTACSSPEETDPQYIFQRKIDTLPMESFKIPDSINTSLIIASYFDPEFNIQTLLVFDDAEKKAVKKIDYLSDTTATVDQLEILKANEFRSNRYLVDYVVEETAVQRIQVRHLEGPLQKSRQYRRTDRD